MPFCRMTMSGLMGSVYRMLNVCAYGDCREQRGDEMGDEEV